jgi:hypothetical protein
MLMAPTTSLAEPMAPKSRLARLSGWYIGAGLDMALSHGWVPGLEYRHYDFGDRTAVAFSPAGLFVEPARFEATSDTFTVRARWKLGRPEPARFLKYQSPPFPEGGSEGHGDAVAFARFAITFRGVGFAAGSQRSNSPLMKRT